jgi:hypothetical protein
MAETKNSIDEASPFKYNGRKFLIESDGTGVGTKIYIDEKEQKYVTYLRIEIPSPRETVQITMTYDDIESRETS